MNDDNHVTAPVQSQNVASHSSSFETAPQEITSEILTVIQTAAAVFVARKLQSEKTQPDKDTSSWSDQGRNIVQASHNLVQRGH